MDSLKTATGIQTCYLVSDIPFGSPLWAPFAENEFKDNSRRQKMNDALRILGVFGGSKRNCKKLDSVINASVVDTGYLSIYDKILAVEATSYSACIDTSDKLCKKCTRTQSQFQSEILYLRNLKLKKSALSWHGKQEYADIYSGDKAKTLLLA
eukprot:m.118610 g.118610  ORF g.118610 m.118610 type:complete len:153 (-) comp14281_c0_seq5:2880-3338(-)